MRLWTIHPEYLDAKGLVALWREALLAQKVLQGKTKGYKHHPQLIRFRALRKPEAAIASYLWAVLREARRRGYAFDGKKISHPRFRSRVPETSGQLAYEWRHLLGKLAKRDRTRYRQYRALKTTKCHPLFRIVDGAVQDWERI
jgi:hypothetical protein